MLNYIIFTIFICVVMFISYLITKQPICNKFFQEDPNNPHLDKRFSRGKLDSRETHNTLRELLGFFSDHCNKKQIKPIIMHGSLIGYYFGKKILPWDDDIDIILVGDSIEKLKNYSDDDIIIEVNPNSRNYSKLDFLNVISARVISKKNGIFIDITYFKENRKGIFESKDGHSYKKEELFPLKKDLFEGREIYVPNNIESCLIKEYRDKVLLPEYKNWEFKKGIWKNKKQTVIK